MKTIIEYIIVVNDRPFFSVSDPSRIEVIKQEASARFAGPVVIEVYKQTTEPYEVGPDNDK